MKLQDDIENIQNDSVYKVHADKEILHNMAEEDCQLAMKFLRMSSKMPSIVSF